MRRWALAALLCFATASTAEAATITYYVQASSLRLRAKPSPRAKTKGRLRINYALEVLDAAGDFWRVKTRNGATGWVGSRFLGTKRLKLSEALARAERATNPGERLNWVQRAAALSPRDTKVLKRLRDAYLAKKDKRAAKMVDNLLSVLAREWFPAPQDMETDGVWIEWRAVDWSGAQSELPRAKWADYDVPVDRTFWVLPEHGAAVKAKVVAVRPNTWNECGGEQGIELRLDARLPKGERPLVVLGEAPPASWKQAVELPARAELEAAFAKYVRRHFKGRGEVFKSLVVHAGGATGRAAVVVGPGEIEEITQRYEIHDVTFDAAGKVLRSKKQTVDEMNVSLPVARRDITGDGEVETVYYDGCATSVIAVDGSQLFASAYRCCGC